MTRWRLVCRIIRWHSFHCVMQLPNTRPGCRHRHHSHPTHRYRARPLFCSFRPPATLPDFQTINSAVYNDMPRGKRILPAARAARNARRNGLPIGRKPTYIARNSNACSVNIANLITGLCRSFVGSLWSLPGWWQVIHSQIWSWRKEWVSFFVWGSLISNLAIGKFEAKPLKPEMNQESVCPIWQQENCMSWYDLCYLPFNEHPWPVTSPQRRNHYVKFKPHDPEEEDQIKITEELETMYAS